MLHVAAAITMTLMGCNDDTTDCYFLPQADKSYPSQIACESSIPAKLKKMNNAPYPVITAQCSQEKTKGTTIKNASKLPAPRITPTHKTSNIVPKTSNNERRKPLRRVLVRIENGFAYVTKGTVSVLENIGQRVGNRLRQIATGLKLR